VLYAYDDANDNRIEPGDPVVGTLTIGWGSTTDVTPGMTITQAQADARLEADLAIAERAVAAAVELILSPNQFSALVSFEYNTGALVGSKMQAFLNEGDFTGAANEFGAWIYGGSPLAVLEGLVRRREAEKQLFLEPG
jgi:lysozyme